MIDLKNLEPGTVLEVIEEQGLQTYVMTRWSYQDLNPGGGVVQAKDLSLDAILEEGTAFMFMGFEVDEDAYHKERFVIFHNEQTIYGLVQDHLRLTRYIGRLTS